jgi:CRP/FNR family transcriptional regulator
MSTDALLAFDEIKVTGAYPKGTLLFSEGRPVRGIYLLCSGRAKLSICAENGKRLTLHIAGPGEVLGLEAALSNTPYEVTAELIDPSQVVFLRRRDLVKFLRQHREVCLRVVDMLSRDLHGAYERVRNIGTVRLRRPRLSQRSRLLLT